MAKNEVMTTEKTDVTVAEAPQLVIEVQQEDMMIPFLKVIQSLSDEVVQGNSKYNPDVRPGNIYDGVTKTIFKDAKAIVCGLKKYYTEWTPDVRGKLLGKHAANSAVVLNAVKKEVKTEKGSFTTLSTKEGNNLIETYGVVLVIKNGDGTILPGVLTLAKTSFMTGKQLSTILAIHQTKGIPVFNLTTAIVSNAKGSWYKPSFTFDSYETNPDVIAMAKSLAGMVDQILFRNESEDSDSAEVDNTIVADDGLL